MHDPQQQKNIPPCLLPRLPPLHHAPATSQPCLLRLILAPNKACIMPAQSCSQEFSRLLPSCLAPEYATPDLQICAVQVIADSVSNRSKGYGFVRFGSEQERDMALGQMNGIHINNRPIRVSLATAKKNPGQATIAPVAQPPHPSDFDPTNTTLFIGGLSGGVTEEQLRAVFAAYGDIVYVKVPPGKGCGFVQFVQRAAAESAMGHMQGQLLGSSSIRISWGRSNSSRSQVAAAPTHTPSYAYSAYAAPAAAAAAAATAAYGAGYDTNLLAQYGYTAPAADPYAAYYAAAMPQSDPYSVRHLFLCGQLV